MPIVVEAVSEEDFAAWVAKQDKIEDKNTPKPIPSTGPGTLSRSTLMTLGKEKYEVMCSACHGF